jgi:hypothetical protein
MRERRQAHIRHYDDGQGHYACSAACVFKICEAPPTDSNTREQQQQQ